jgi:hypothetical protein
MTTGEHDNLNPEDFGYTADELKDAKVMSDLGDALLENGFTIASDDEIKSMMATAERQKHDFPYNLSLGGFVIKRPDTWVTTNITEIDTEPTPSVEELLAGIKGPREAELDMTCFRNLDEAVAVGNAFPDHPFYDRFHSQEEGCLYGSGNSPTATIVGLTVVRLMFDKSNLDVVLDHDEIDPGRVYYTEYKDILAYDFVRADADDTLMLYVPQPRNTIPVPNRSVIDRIIKETYYPRDGKSGKAEIPTNPQGLRGVLDENNHYANDSEIRVVKRILADQLAIAKDAGLGEEEIENLKTALISQIFGQ